MRAFPLVVALLACTPALAQVSEDITHPLIVGPGVTATVRTMRESTRHDASAFATAGFSNTVIPWGGYMFEFGTSARAVNLSNISEALVEATITTTKEVFFSWQMVGPSELRITGEGVPNPIIQEIHHGSAHSPWFPPEYCGDEGIRFIDVQRNVCPGYLLPPGTYDLRIHNQLTSGEYDGTASIGVMAFVVPEPSTLILVAVGLVVLATHRLRRSGFLTHRRSWSPA